MIVADPVARKDLFKRLEWCYGTDRAANIINGKDAEANADFVRWLMIGRKRDRRS